MDRKKMEAQMPGAREDALFVRPIEAFGQLWPQVAALGRSRPIHPAVVGAGAAGLKLAMAAAHALGGTGGPPPAQNYPAGVQRRHDLEYFLNCYVFDSCLRLWIKG